MSWAQNPLRYFITRKNERDRTDLPLLSVVRERGVVVRHVKDNNHNIIPDDLSKYLTVFEGQFVINKMKAWQGSCGVSNFNGIVSPAYFVFDLRFENKRFFDYAIRSRSYKAEFARISSGIRVGQWDLSIQGLKNVVFSYPSAPVQDRIVRWLDWQTSRIAHYTRTKKREIECLRELKKAIISEAVTRGLDPHAKMKRAMTYFEHDIPKHWNEVKIKRVLTPLSRSYDADEEILMLSSSSIICNIYSWMLELYELYENIDL